MFTDLINNNSTNSHVLANKAGGSNSAENISKADKESFTFFFLDSNNIIFERLTS